MRQGERPTSYLPTIFCNDQGLGLWRIETIIQEIPFPLGDRDLPWIQLHEAAKMLLKTKQLLEPLLVCRLQDGKDRSTWEAVTKRKSWRRRDNGGGSCSNVVLGRPGTVAPPYPGDPILYDFPPPSKTGLSWFKL